MDKPVKRETAYRVRAGPCPACNGEGFVNVDYFDDPERCPEGYRTLPCPTCYPTETPSGYK